MIITITGIGRFDEIELMYCNMLRRYVLKIVYVLYAAQCKLVFVESVSFACISCACDV